MLQSRLTALALVAAVAWWGGGPAEAADHREAPITLADPAADIADLYAWADGTKLNAVITFAGFDAPITNQAGTYDEDVLYTLHLDSNQDNVADTSVRVRFGRNTDNDWGVQVLNLPGDDEAIEGPVEQVLIGDNGTRVYAGLRDDPFFFDLTGFQQTLMTGTLAFNDERDSFEGLNVTAIVLQMDLAAATGTTGKVNVWATTARK